MTSADPFKAPWEAWAKEYGTSGRVTFQDTLQFDLEAETIAECLKPRGERILDIGCGNGAMLKKLLKRGIKPAKLGGCDISEPLLKIALKNVPHGNFFGLDISNSNHPNWKMARDFEPTTIIIKRVLANLAGRRPQRHALITIGENAPRGCKFIIIEAMLEGLQNLNMLRRAFGMPLICEPPFNEYLRFRDVEFCLETMGCSNISKYDYTSTYYIGSRVLQPFLWPDKKPTHVHAINKYFRKLPNQEGFGLHWLIRAVKT